MQTAPTPTEPVAAPRVDPALTRTLRRAIEHTCLKLPDFDAPLRRSLVRSYREAEGARAATVWSTSKTALREHVETFRSRYPRALGACLQARLRRLRGADDADAIDAAVSSDARLGAIDGLARHLEVDGDLGLAEFDQRLSRLLGVPPAGWRSSPMSPSVFFDAIGRCWVQVSGSDRDEIEVIHGFGRLLLPSIASLYPELVALLPARHAAIPQADALRVALSAEGLSDDAAQVGSTTARAITTEAITTETATAETITAETITAETITAETATADAGTARADAAAASAARAALDHAERLFERTLRDPSLPTDARLLIARLQIPFLRMGLEDGGVLDDDAHPLRRMLADAGRSAAWTPDARESRLAGLAAIVDALGQSPGPGALEALLARSREVWAPVGSADDAVHAAALEVPADDDDTPAAERDPDDGEPRADLPATATAFGRPVPVPS